MVKCLLIAIQLILITLLYGVCDRISTTEEINTFKSQKENSSEAHSFAENITTVTELKIDNNETDISKENKTNKLVNCYPKLGNRVVDLMNDTELIKMLQPDQKVKEKDFPAFCLLVLFYSRYCPFSSMAAPHFNALPRAFPDIKMVAINAIMYHLFNTQNGIVGVPSIILFHAGRPVAKFNESEYTLEQFSNFLTKHTGIKATEKSTVMSSDFTGPVVSSPFKDFDMLLVICWIFIITCSGYYFTKSKWWKWIIETVKSNWRESEAHAQHEHVD